MFVLVNISAAPQPPGQYCSLKASHQAKAHFRMVKSLSCANFQH